MSSKVLLSRHWPQASIPKRMTAGSVGFDLTSLCPTELPPGQVTPVGTGLAFVLPPSTELQIRPRSGLARDGLIAVFGTVDSDYRGEVSVLVHNITNRTVHLDAGVRIAQAVFQCCSEVVYEVIGVEEFMTKFADTARGQAGFGSTGYR